MTATQVRRLTGVLLILVPAVFTACFTLLQSQFEYPDILRQSTADILTKFQAGGSSLIAVWYVLTLSAVLLVPIAVLLRRALAPAEQSMALDVATTFGIIAGVAQTLGFLRWPFLVPRLTELYFAPDATDAQRAAVTVVFEGFHRYAGMAVGEHLGYLCTSVWTLLLASTFLRSAGFERWLGFSGMALALGIATGLLEPAGWETAGVINAFSYLGWALWLVILGGRLLLRPANAVAAPTPGRRPALAR